MVTTIDRIFQHHERSLFPADQLYPSLLYESTVSSFHPLPVFFSILCPFAQHSVKILLSLSIPLGLLCGVDYQLLTILEYEELALSSLSHPLHIGYLWYYSRHTERTEYTNFNNVIVQLDNVCQLYCKFRLLIQSNIIGSRLVYIILPSAHLVFQSSYIMENKCLGSVPVRFH